MSSQTNKPIHFSVARYVLLAALLGFSLIAISALVFSTLAISSANNAQQEVLYETRDEALAIFEEDGLDELLTLYDNVWDDADDPQGFIPALEAHHILYAVYNAQGEHIAGSRLPFDYQQAMHVHSMTYDEETFTVLTLGFELSDTLTVHLARLQYDEASEVLSHLLFALILGLLTTVLISALVTLLINRQVNQRLNTLTQQLDGIAQKPDSSRLSTSNHTDSFDQLACTINQMLDDIAALNRNMQVMSVGIAHDLKTPLSRVANRLQLMLQDIDDRAMLNQHIERADESLRAIITTFNNLIRLNDIESGKRKQGFKALDLSLLIQDLADSYEPVFADSGRQLEISVVEGVHCLGDSDLLSQLICNLLENALEYSNAQANVWVRLQYHTTGALLQIGDNGPGIPSEAQAQVFERFYRGDTSRGKPGNGLGLSIVKAICELHDAHINLLTQQQGAVFNIELPINQGK